MTKKLLFVMTLALVVAFVALAADPSGKWTFEQPRMGRGGGGGAPQTVTVTMNLKASGGTLTGDLSQPGRNGDLMKMDISEGKVEGDNISFAVSRETPNGTFKTTYKGTVKGDTIDLEISRPAFGGGEAPPPLKVTAKKATT